MVPEENLEVTEEVVEEEEALDQEPEFDLENPEPELEGLEQEPVEEVELTEEEKERAQLFTDVKHSLIVARKLVHARRPLQKVSKNSIIKLAETFLKVVAQ